MKTPESIIRRYMFNYAMECHDQRISQFPLRGKKPAYGLLPRVDGKPSWKPFQSQAPILGQLRDWFGYESDLNRAIVCGSISGVMAFDLDSPEITRWFEENMPKSDMVTKTGEDRFHIYYQIPKGLKVGNRVKINGLPLDCRGAGGYCGAPGNIHPETGFIYEKIGNWNLQDVPFADPAWFSEEKREVRRSIVPNDVIATARKYINYIQAISGNGGHNSTYRAACYLSDKGLTKEESLELLIDWNQTNADPTWSVSELEHKIEDALHRGD